MRPQTDLRARRACAALAVLGLTYTVSINAPVSARAQSTATTPAPQARLGSATPLYPNGTLLVVGHVAGGQAGTPVTLQYRAGATSGWSTLAGATSGAGGAYWIAARLAQSGAVRVTSAPAATARAVGTPVPAPGVSAELLVQVRAALSARQRQLDVLAGHRATVAGAVAPARAGREVTLQLRTARGWSTVARAFSGAQGRYRLAYTPGRTGSQPARVRFAGDAANAPSARPLGRLNAYRLAAVSWYGAGGALACGGSLGSGTLGVANKTLPCGTMVTLRYGGRRVRVPVIDRGPYVAGREFDLTAATKSALGFGDTGEVWTTA